MSTSFQRGPLCVLVGAGSGDPQLITLAGARWLSRAQVVVYDRLASPALLALAPATAERIYVGKGPLAHAMEQEQINELLVRKCGEGKLVVRLKGGDPYVFGRGGEEADALTAAGIAFRVVPGVTAAVAGGAYAGIPVTDRRLASCVALVTGHEDPTKEDSTLNWAALAGIDTVAFYMGVGNLAHLARRLIDAGRSADTPCAVVAQATTPRQRTVTGTLATIADIAQKAGIQAPAITIVGQVVALRQGLNWFEHLPLAGQTVLVTRTRQQASELSACLAELGAEVIEAPTIAIEPPADWSAVDAAIADLSRWDWLVLTSPNGAEHFFARMAEKGFDARALGGVKIAAVGPATADALRARSILPDLLPKEFTTASLSSAMVEQLGYRAPAGRSAPARVLLARADIATPELADALKSAGVHVDEITVYRTISPASLSAEAISALRENRVDWITFTSSSTASNFLALLKQSGLALPAIAAAGKPGRLKLAAIGPVTASTLREHGLEPAIVAHPHTIDALAQALADWKQNSEPNSHTGK